MYDTSPDDDLQNLEIEFCKVSELFYKSINDLKNYIVDYQNGCDSCVTQTQIKLNNINFYKIYCFIVSILFIIAMVILIFF